MVELIFDNRTSVFTKYASGIWMGRGDMRHKKNENRKHLGEVCLKHLKGRLEKLSSCQAGKELSEISAMTEEEEQRSGSESDFLPARDCLRREAKRVINIILGSELLADKYRKKPFKDTLLPTRRSRHGIFEGVETDKLGK